mmetsp:Transcript_31895/g.74424  ORF Transcript_31895/g.74424 Transcript_31895/m.74424 type:complete len:1576 (-) Transcript_31895:213-4940(-)
MVDAPPEVSKSTTDKGLLAAVWDSPAKSPSALASRAANAFAMLRIGANTPHYTPRVERHPGSHTAAVVTASDARLASIFAFALDADGEQLAVAGPGTLVLLRIGAFGHAGISAATDASGSSSVVWSLPAPLLGTARLAFAECGRTVAVMEGDGANSVLVVRTRSPDKAFTLTSEKPAEGLAVSADGLLVAITGRSRAVEVHLVKARGEEEPTWVFKINAFVFTTGTCIAFSPDAEHLAVGGDLSKCVVWDIDPNATQEDMIGGAGGMYERLVKVLARGGRVNDAAYTEAGSLFALASSDSSVAIYRVADGYTMLCELKMPLQVQYRIAWSFPDPEHSLLGEESAELSKMPHCGHPDAYGLLLAVQSSKKGFGARTALVHAASMTPITQTHGSSNPAFARSGLYAEMRANGQDIVLANVNERSDVMISPILRTDSNNDHRSDIGYSVIADATPISALAVSRAGEHVATYRRGSELSLVHTASNSEVVGVIGALDGLAFGGNVVEMEWAPDRECLAILISLPSLPGSTASKCELVLVDIEDGSASIACRVPLDGSATGRGANYHGEVCLHWDETGDFVAAFALLNRVRKPVGQQEPKTTSSFVQGLPEDDVSSRYGRVSPYAFGELRRTSEEESQEAIVLTGQLPRRATTRTASVLGLLGKSARWVFAGGAADEIAVAVAAGAPLPLQNDAYKTHVVHVVSARTFTRVCTVRARAEAPRPTAVLLRIPLQALLARTEAGKGEWGHRAFTKGDPISSLSPVFKELGASKCSALACSRDGCLIAAGGKNTLLFVDACTREAIVRVTTSSWVQQLEFSTDDRLLAVASLDKTVGVYDVTSGIRLLDVGLVREFVPACLAFSHDCTCLADGNRALALHSCDGSRLPLRKHLDPTHLLLFPTPEWFVPDDGVAAEDDLQRQKFVSLLVDLVKRNPLLAFNPLPPEDALVNSEAIRALHEQSGILQPLRDDGARLIELLAFNQERMEVQGLLRAFPALSLMPSSPAHETPAFEVAIKRRDARLVRILLAASCRAPVAMRTGVLSTLVPLLVKAKLGSAVALFLASDEAQLEPSGSTVRAACLVDGTPLDDLSYELHETWGGEGTRIWAHLEPARQQLSSDGSANVGVEVTPLRGPLPALCRRETILALLEVPQRGTFRSPIIRPYINALWEQVFLKRHMRKTARTFLQFFTCLAYASLLAAGARSFWLGSGEVGSLDGLFLAILGCSMMLFGVMLFAYEALQAYDDGETVWEMVQEYTSDLYNLPDLLQAMLTIFAVLAEFYPPIVGQPATCIDIEVSGEVCRAIWSQYALVWALAFQFLRLMQELRGYEYTGWLVEALTANMIDSAPFMFLVFLLITTFGGIFLLLFTPAIDRSRLASLEKMGGGTLQLMPFDDLDTGFGHIAQAWLSSYAIGMFAEFDLGNFSPENTLNQGLASFFLVMYLIVLGIVVLNALIALLGDSYQRVQDNQLETKMRLRAHLMIEYLNIMNTQKRAKLERQTMWLHVLEVVNDADVPEWAGQLNAFKMEVRLLETRTTTRITSMQRKVLGEMDSLSEKIDDLSKRVIHFARADDKDEKKDTQDDS